MPLGVLFGLTLDVVDAVLLDPLAHKLNYITHHNVDMIIIGLYDQPGGADTLLSSPDDSGVPGSGRVYLTEEDLPLGVHADDARLSKTSRTRIRGTSEPRRACRLSSPSPPPPPSPPPTAQPRC